MEFRVCTNCGKIHLLDEKIDKKRQIVDGKLEPIKCTCVFPNVIRVWEYVEEACKRYAFYSFIKKFVIENELYEFAFKCFGEELKQEYSDKIKKAVVNSTVFPDRDIVQLLEKDIVLFKKFYKGFEGHKYRNRKNEIFLKNR